MADEIVAQETRICRVCHEEKSLSGFHTVRGGKFQTACRVCANADCRRRARIKWEQSGAIESKKARYARLRLTEEGLAKLKEIEREIKTASQRRRMLTPEAREISRAKIKAYRWKNLEKARTAERKCRLERVYALSMEQFKAMLSSQNHSCPICLRGIVEFEPRKTWRTACVDHDHSTGKVRALLCTPCNSGIGALGDDPERVDRGAAYLRSHQ